MLSTWEDETELAVRSATGFAWAFRCPSSGCLRIVTRWGLRRKTYQTVFRSRFRFWQYLCSRWATRIPPQRGTGDLWTKCPQVTLFNVKHSFYCILLSRCSDFSAFFNIHNAYPREITHNRTEVMILIIFVLWTAKTDSEFKMLCVMIHGKRLFPL